MASHVESNSLSEAICCDSQSRGYSRWVGTLSVSNPRPYITLTNQISSSEIINPSFAYPKRKQVIPIIADAMIAVFVPIISIILVNIVGIATHGPHGKRLCMTGKRGGILLGRGSFWNVNNGCMGVIYSVMTGATLQIIIKLVIGGLRPHFLTVCDPQIDGVQGMGYGRLYFDTSVCRDHTDPKRRDEIANAMQSFPSGHSIAAWAGLLYLSLYFNAHLKIFSNYHPSYWKLLLFVTPMLAATLIVGSLLLDMSHNWYDIVLGSVLGAVMAILSYRMCFAAVWDFRFNHIPLARDPRIPGLNYSIEELEDWSGGCATRRGGWGVARRYSTFNRGWGAPGDCALQSAGVSPGLAGVDSLGGWRCHHRDRECRSGVYNEESTAREPAMPTGARGPAV